MRQILLLPLFVCLLIPMACCNTTPVQTEEEGGMPERDGVSLKGWESDAMSAGAAAPRKLPLTGTFTTPGTRSLTPVEAADEKMSLRRANKLLADRVTKLMSEVEQIKAGSAEPASGTGPAPVVIDRPAMREEPVARIDAGRLQSLLRSANVRDLDVSARPGGSVAVTLPGNVSFGSGKAKLMKGAESRLAMLANILRREFPTATVRAEGHTDSDPIRKSAWRSNKHLSEARAQAVADYLTGRAGLPRNQVASAGFGDSNPVAPNSTRAGKALNRRVELILN